MPYVTAWMTDAPCDMSLLFSLQQIRDVNISVSPSRQHRYTRGTASTHRRPRREENSVFGFATREGTDLSEPNDCKHGSFVVSRLAKVGAEQIQRRKAGSTDRQHVWDGFVVCLRTSEV